MLPSEPESRTVELALSFFPLPPLPLPQPQSHVTVFLYLPKKQEECPGQSPWGKCGTADGGVLFVFVVFWFFFPPTKSFCQWGLAL